MEIDRRSACCFTVHGDIRLVLVLPCRDQTWGGHRRDMEIHELVKTLADGLICLSESYHEGCI